MADRAVIVIAFDHEDIESFREVLGKVKPVFADQKEVSVYGVTHESAATILELVVAASE